MKSGWKRVRKAKATNPELLKLVDSLMKQSRENEAKVWRDVAERMVKSRRRRVSVNLSRLNRYTSRNETVAVPGKVLATGEITHPVTVAAFSFSRKAKDKIKAARGRCVFLSDLAKKNPKGSNVKIIG
jgi:large subunit ribosomal protein L18e